MRTPRRFATAAAALTATGALVFPVVTTSAFGATHSVAVPAGTARVVPVSGTTMLKLYPATAAALTSHHISVAPASETKVGASGLEFPIVGGWVNPMTLSGSISHDGGLTFKAGGKALTIRDFTLNTGSHRLTAWVDQVGARIPVLDVGLTKAKVSASKIKLNVSNVTVTLDSVAAKALNAYFGTKLFSTGLPIGTVRLSADIHIVRTT